MYIFAVSNVNKSLQNYCVRTDKGRIVLREEWVRRVLYMDPISYAYIKFRQNLLNDDFRIEGVK